MVNQVKISQPIFREAAQSNLYSLASAFLGAEGTDENGDRYIVSVRHTLPSEGTDVFGEDDSGQRFLVGKVDHSRVRDALKVFDSLSGLDTLLSDIGLIRLKDGIELINQGADGSEVHGIVNPHEILDRDDRFMYVGGRLVGELVGQQYPWVIPAKKARRPYDIECTVYLVSREEDAAGRTDKTDWPHCGSVLLDKDQRLAGILIDQNTDYLCFVDMDTISSMLKMPVIGSPHFESGYDEMLLRR